MKRAEAFALVRKSGGTPREGVTKGTHVLIVGQLGWPLLDDGRPSNNLARAKAYRVPIASERQFLTWLGRAASDDQARSYTSAQLASLAKLPEPVIEQMALFGLIEPQGGLYGFRDVAAARQVAGLLAAGVKLSAITKSLLEVRKWLPDAGLANLRLFPESSDRLVIEQMKGRSDSRGQWLLSVEGPGEEADALFAKARAAEEENDLETAARFYRRLMLRDPRDPVAPFNLGNVLRAMGGHEAEVEKVYRAAVRADRAFARAWYNLADVLDDQGRTQEAVECLRRALDADPGYADAMFNMGLFLQRLERHAEAAVWWKRYLEQDSDSPWAARARRALKYCEMQLAGSAS